MMLGSPRSGILTICRQIDSPRPMASPGTKTTPHMVRVTFDTSAARVSRSGSFDMTLAFGLRATAVSQGLRRPRLET